MFTMHSHENHNVNESGQSVHEMIDFIKIDVTYKRIFVMRITIRRNWLRI